MTKITTVHTSKLADSSFIAGQAEGREESESEDEDEEIGEAAAEAAMQAAAGDGAQIVSTDDATVQPNGDLNNSVFSAMFLFAEPK